MNAVLVHSLYVGLGGFAGSVLRYLASVAVAGCGLWQPLATFGVNALGALILGAILACGAAGQGGAVARHLLAIGFCGGFTTFSTFAFETFELIERNCISAAILYAMLSVVLGIGAVFAAKAICA